MALYDAFISYSHAQDKPIAAALQSVIQKLGKPWYRRRALRVFRDDTSLSATPHLWPTIQKALSESRFLILLASPEAAASHWVDKELRYWLEHKSVETLLIAVTDGELVWDDAAGDFNAGNTVPPAIKGRLSAEPRWVDLTGYRGGVQKRDVNFSDHAADFAAAIRGIPKEDLLSQEVRQQRRALTMAWTSVASLLILMSLATWQWREASTQRTQAQAQRDQALINNSRFLARDANSQIENGATLEGLLVALEAFSEEPNEAERLKLQEADTALQRGLSAPREQMAMFLKDSTSGSYPDSFLSPKGEYLFISKQNGGELRNTLNGRVLKTFDGPTSDYNVFSIIAFDADENRMLLGTIAGQLTLWQIAPAKPIWMAQEEGTHEAEFSRDGKLLVTAGERGIQLRSADTGQVLWSLNMPSSAVALSPDASRLIAQVSDRKTRSSGLLSFVIQTGAIKIVPTKDYPDISDIKFSPDSKLIVTYSPLSRTRLYGPAQLWDTSLTHLHSLTGEDEKNSAFQASWSANGEWLAVSFRFGSVRLWSPRSLQAPPIILQSTVAFDHSFSPTSQFLATAHDDGIIRIWSVPSTPEQLSGVARNPTPVFTLHGHQQFVSSVRFIHSRSELVSNSRGDETIRIWDLLPHAPKRFQFSLQSRTTSIAVPYGNLVFGNIGDQLAVSLSNGEVRILNLGTHTEVRINTGQSEAPKVKFTPDGKRMIASARLWNSETGAVMRELQGEIAVLSSVGKIATNKGGEVTLIDPANGSVINKWNYTGDRSASFSEEGNWLILQRGRERSLYDVQTGARIGSISADNIYFNRGETILIVEEWGSDTLSLIDTKGFTKTGTLSGCLDKDVKYGNGSFAFSSDGRRIAAAYSAAGDEWASEVLGPNIVCSWDLKTLELKSRFVFAGYNVKILDLSADGKFAVTADQDFPGRLERRRPSSGQSYLRLWNLTEAKQIRELWRWPGLSGGLNVSVSASFTRDGRYLILLEPLGQYLLIYESDTGHQKFALQLGLFRYEPVFNADGTQFAAVDAVNGMISVWIVDPGSFAPVQEVKANASRCLTTNQRRQAFLPAEPPTWCVTGAGRENESNPGKWVPLWPYQGNEWREWLLSKRAGKAVSLPAAN